jgi:non-specific protein-tyrosine kinase
VYYRDLLLRTWWLVVLCAVLAGVTACAATIAFFPVYEVSTLLQVDFPYPPPASTSYAPQGFTISGNATTILKTEVQLVVSPSVLAQVAAENPGVDASRLRSKVSVHTIATSFLLQITVEDSQPQRAAAIANDLDTALVTSQQTIYRQAITTEAHLRQDMTALEQQEVQVGQALTALGTPPSDPTQAAALQAHLASLQQQLSQDDWNLTLDQNTLSWTLRVAQPAVPPTAPHLSRIAIGTGAGVASGALLAVLLALAIDGWLWPVRSGAAVADLLGVPLLGEVPSPPDAAAAGDASAVDAALGMLTPALVRALDFFSIDQPLQTLAVLSPQASPLATGSTGAATGSTRGATGASTGVSTLASTLAAQLALALARQGRRTLLLDTQLATGEQSRRFGLPPAPGLSDAALERPHTAPGDGVLLRYAHPPVTVPAPSLLVLPSGTPPPHPDQVLASHAMQRLLAALEQLPADSIILDTPPLLGHPGHPRRGKAVSVLLRYVEGALLVVDLPRTSKAQLQRAQRLLAATGVPVLGCVVAVPAPARTTGADNWAVARPARPARPAPPAPPAAPAPSYRALSPGGSAHDE